MIYDVYEQDAQKQDIIGMRKIVRYHTKNKQKAFEFMDAKNTLAKANRWHVAEQRNDRIYFDIDNEDFDNVKLIKAYYEPFFEELKVIKTYHGYHLVSRKYDYSVLGANIQWQYDTCRVLNPLLDTRDLQKYIEAVQRFYKAERDKQHINGLDKIEFTEYLPKMLKESGLYFGVGEFDILFALNVIMKGYYCIRISKKAIDDKPYIVTNL
jgi:hypothetical protein